MAPQRRAGKSDKSILNFLLENKTTDGAQKAVAMITEIRPSKWSSNMTEEETLRVCCHTWKNAYQNISKHILRDSGNKNPCFDKHLEELLMAYPDESILRDVQHFPLERQHRFYRNRYAHDQFTSKKCYEMFKKIAPVQEWFYSFILDRKIYEASKKRVDDEVKRKQVDTLVVDNVDDILQKAAACVRELPARYRDLEGVNSGVKALKNCCYEAFWSLCLLTGRRPHELCDENVVMTAVDGKPYQIMINKLAKKDPFKESKPWVFPVLTRSKHVLQALAVLRGAKFDGKGREGIHARAPKTPATGLFGGSVGVKYGVFRGIYGQCAFHTRHDHGWGITFCRDKFLQLVRGHKGTAPIRPQDHYDTLTLNVPLGAKIFLE
jgi:integrase